MNPDGQSATGGFEVLTSPGPAAIAVIRVRGPQTATFLERHVQSSRPAPASSWQPGRVWRAELRDATGAAIDDILLSVHSSLPTYDLRLHLHGNPWLVRHCADLLHACGLEPAGEDRTTLWPAEDALEAEAYALLPRILTLRGARWLLRQVGRLRTAIGALIHSASPEAVRKTCGEIAARSDVVEWFLRPLRVVLAGPPNVGKSTLANALADRAASVVSPTPGTTRDWVEVPGEASGFPVVWLDVAGLHESADALERAGIKRAHQLMQAADAVVVVLDVTTGSSEAQARFLDTYQDLTAACVALNKSDLGGCPESLRDLLPAEWQRRAVSISATERNGLDALCQTVLTSLGRTAASLDQPAAFTPRQAELLKETAAETDCNTMRTKLLRFLEASGPR